MAGESIFWVMRWLNKGLSVNSTVAVSSPAKGPLTVASAFGASFRFERNRKNENFGEGRILQWWSVLTRA
eukprot:1181933-Prorocentrum_minimum.AAC.6